MVTIQINGRLSEDPQQQETNGYKFTRFSVAARTNRKDSNGQYISNFFRCSCLGSIGDTIARYFHKGDGIVLTGNLSVREYVSTSGEKRFSLDVEVRDFDFGIGKKGEGQTGGESHAPAASKRSAPAPAPAETADDDLPF